MKESKLNFVYDKISSEELEIFNVAIDTSELEEQLFINKTFNEIFLEQQDKYLLTNIDQDPIVLVLSFSFKAKWDEDLIKQIVELFNTGYYKPLWFEDNPDCIFYCMYQGEAKLIHNALKEGYVEIELRCNDIHTYSQIKEQSFNFVPEEIGIIEFDFIDDYEINLSYQNLNGFSNIINNELMYLKIIDESNGIASIISKNQIDFTNVDFVAFNIKHNNIYNNYYSVFSLVNNKDDLESIELIQNNNNNDELILLNVSEINDEYYLRIDQKYVSP